MSNISKRLCCTCLSGDRKLFQLYRIPDGVNLLYMLLQCDADAYMEGFFKDIASWLVCWECSAIINKIKSFRAQTCTALKLLRDIADGQNKKEALSLSHLSVNNNPAIIIQTEIFIDCGQVKDIKNENTVDLIQNSFKDEHKVTYSFEDEHNVTNNFANEHNVTNGFAKEHNVTNSFEDEHKITNSFEDEHNVTNSFEGEDNVTNSFENEQNITNSVEDEHKVTNSFENKHNVTNSFEDGFENECSINNLDGVIKVKKKKLKKSEKTNKFYSITVMTEEELKMVIENRQFELENEFKCDSCALGFKSNSDLNTHNLEHHTKKVKHSLCNVCLSYIKEDILDSHTKDHYRVYVCKLCAHKAYTQESMDGHLDEKHNGIIGKKKRKPKKAVKLDEPRKYPCAECDLIFENKGAKWKHVQKSHRAGHKCLTCEKIFTFKHNLERHALSHEGGHPRSPCPVCHKSVRTSSMGAHVNTHGARVGLSCAPCGVRLACRATYAAHLKYARAHAAHETLRYACASCDKKYRSRGELRDHVAYRHDNQPRHKCPVCDKSLATRRCVTRHVKRAHEGLKENARDKMCDYCGKAFRDKKSLSEHVSRHTGARPHACAHCGRAFRQRAALHAHTRRVHAH